ncbi:hypothetical protein QOT17_011742 [Balamuthia mandrillaris]
MKQQHKGTTAEANKEKERRAEEYAQAEVRALMGSGSSHKHPQHRQPNLNTVQEAEDDILDLSIDMLLSAKASGQVPSSKVAQRKRELESIVSRKIKNLREDMKTAPFIKLRDKISFIIGLTNVALSSFLVARFPEWMPFVFVVKSIILLSLRTWLFRKEKMHYYLFDFCYFANLLVLLWVLVFPQSEVLFQICFAFSFGPLAWAIVAWRNSLVLHSLSRTTSLFIHFTPGLMLYSMRWLANDDYSLTHYNTMRNSSPTFVSMTLLPLLPYILWQTLYYLKVEIFSYAKVQERDYETSFKYLSQGKGMMGSLLRKVNRRYQVFAFMAYQLVYTVLTISPCLIYFHSFWVHTLFIFSMFLASVWNGANFYIEVFASRYVNSLKQRTLQMERIKSLSIPTSAAETQETEKAEGGSKSSLASLEEVEAELKRLQTLREKLLREKKATSS